MSKKCSKCDKTVYPTEELKCLDKIWHKACFKCEVCGMVLNMKNYKGYEKLPYCNAHYPHTKHTQVADTPEARRIAENTKIQSQVQYHSDFEKSKGIYTMVTDNPEMQRHSINKKNASLVQYHEDFEKNKGQVTAIADTVEMQRHAQNTKNFSLVQYHADFEKLKGTKTSVVEDPEIARIKQNTAIQSNINYWGVREQRNAMEERRPHESLDEAGNRKSYPGKISEYDPGTSQFNSPYSGKAQANVVYDSHMGEGRAARPKSEDLQNPGRRQPGSISDYDPLNQQFGSISAVPGGAPRGFYGPDAGRQQAYQPPPPQPNPPKAAANKGMVCRALYDYMAADSDEVSFQDGDLIIECQHVDAGWMTGRVERTGQYGMLPSNYVERMN